VAGVINCYIENLSAKRILVLFLILKNFSKFLCRTEKVILAHAYHLTMLSECITVVFLLEVHIFKIFLAYFVFRSSTFVFCLQVEKIVTIMSNPRQYKIPDWFLNRQKDIVDGKYSQVCNVCCILKQPGLEADHPLPPYAFMVWFLINP
jgi:hypothetical protein